MVVMVMVKWGFILLTGNEGIQKPTVYPLSWIFKYCLQLLSSVQVLSQTMDTQMSVLLIFYLGETSHTLSPRAMRIKQIIVPPTTFLSWDNVAQVKDHCFVHKHVCISACLIHQALSFVLLFIYFCLVKMLSWKSLGDPHSYWLFFFNDMRKVAVSISKWIIGVRVEISRWMRTLQLRTFI